MRTWPRAEGHKKVKGCAEVNADVSFHPTNGTATANSVTASHIPENLDGVARSLVKLLANACYRHKDNQDKVRELDGLPLLLERFTFDDRNPYIREWAIVAVRNLCEGNAGNQALLAAIEQQPSGVVRAAELEEMGLEVELDPATGRLRAKRRVPLSSRDGAS